MHNKRVVVYGTILFVVGCLVLGIAYRPKKDLEIKEEVLSAQSIEEAEKELKALNKKLDFMIAQADATIKDLQERAAKTLVFEARNNYHDAGYENSWIQDIDKEKGRVLVMTVDSKISIIFKSAPENLDKFHVGWLAPITFQCTKLKKNKCDFSAPYKLFVSNGLVEVEQLKLPKK